MKQYWEIPGPTTKSPRSHCIAFSKLDGSNLRFGWSRKRGWYKFGTRYQMFDHTEPMFGPAIPLFLDTYGDKLAEIFKTEKLFKKPDEAIVYCEFFGPSSFAGWHLEEEPKELVLFDVDILRRGFVLPRHFIKIFGSQVKIPEVLYEGNFGKEFIEDVRNNKYNPEGAEGVVVKGVIPGMKNDQHGLWMAKVKTKSWLARLKKKAQEDEFFRKAWSDNFLEQG